MDARSVRAFITLIMVSRFRAFYEPKLQGLRISSKDRLSMPAQPRASVFPGKRVTCRIAIIVPGEAGNNNNSTLVVLE